MAQLAPSWVYLGSLLGQLGTILGYLGGILSHLGGILGLRAFWKPPSRFARVVDLTFLVMLGSFSGPKLFGFGVILGVMFGPVF